jgi:hypothetical protein
MSNGRGRSGRDRIKVRRKATRNYGSVIANPYPHRLRIAAIRRLAGAQSTWAEKVV